MLHLLHTVFNFHINEVLEGRLTIDKDPFTYKWGDLTMKIESFVDIMLEK
jgi:hypothetical protein